MAWLALVMFGAVCCVLMLGYPVAMTLGGTALLFALLGRSLGGFDAASLETLPSELYGIATNDTLIAVPLFIFMGLILERCRIAEQLLETMARLFGPMRAGLGISVVLVGMLMAASTGIVGATVVTMGLLSLPTMLKRGYDPAIATGTICASGTLGQVIPPSIILVLLGQVISSAYQQAQLAQGNYSPETVSVGDLFIGALLPGLLLVGLFVVYLLIVAIRRPEAVPALPSAEREALSGRALALQVAHALLPPLVLIVLVLGSIIAGAATPTEAASVGAMGALALAALRRELSLARFREACRSSVRITAMVFLILVAATVFALVFRGFGGDQLVHKLLTGLPGGTAAAMAVVMLVMFLLGFILDFIEITYVIVPIVGPVLLQMGMDPVWLGVMIAVNLQTSFLTPPFGFALFYLRGVAPESVRTLDIYRGVMPFIAIQLALLGIMAVWPGLVTWLPAQLGG
jgi:tripartite ATP-independent transporter DctM subunit